MALKDTVDLVILYLNAEALVLQVVDFYSHCVAMSVNQVMTIKS